MTVITVQGQVQGKRKPEGREASTGETEPKGREGKYRGNGSRRAGKAGKAGNAGWSCQLRFLCVNSASSCRFREPC